MLSIRESDERERVTKRDGEGTRGRKEGGGIAKENGRGKEKKGGREEREGERESE